MNHFPTIQVLSVASPDEVNRLWAGLGYYSRAQRLLQGAKVIMEDFGGKVPDSVSELRKIPGIGPYTAGAIASIAYGKSEPLVDGNVVRVLSRLRAIDIETGPKLEKLCWELAACIVDPDNPAAFNQAVMELGATVCKPTSPGCEACPVRSLCRAKLLDEKNAQGLIAYDAHSRGVTYFPVKAEKKKPKELTFAVGVLSSIDGSEERFLFVRRPNKGLLAGPWEFPCIEIDGTYINQNNGTSARELWSLFPPHLEKHCRISISSLADCSHDDSVLQKFKLHGIRDAVPFVSHVFSHQIHRMHVVVSNVSMTYCKSDSHHGFKWMTAAEIANAGITSGCKKILDAITISGKELPHEKRKRREAAKDLKGNASIERFLPRKKGRG